MHQCKTFLAKPQLVASLFLLIFAMPAAAKIVVDFDPNLDFSKYKTFAYTGGIDSLVMLLANPDLIKNRVHRSTPSDLVKKGLREVQPNENPDIVVRYWANGEN